MRNLPSPTVSHITIRVSGTLFQGHIAYLDQLISSANACGLWPVLDMNDLKELDRMALDYLLGGEGNDFAIAACPDFIREWMHDEKQRCAA